MKSIASYLLQHLTAGNDCVLAVIGSTRGSTPQKAGAMMAVCADGTQTGTLGGGGLEYDSVLLAKDLLIRRQNEYRHRVSLSKNSPQSIGMICGGEATTHFFFLSHSDCRWKTLFSACEERADRAQAGFLNMFDDDRISLSDSPAAPDNHLLLSLPLLSQNRAILFGAGHVSAALCPLLSGIGFCVTVFDNRPEYVTKERFPTASVLISADYLDFERFITINEEDYAVVLTASHANDYVVESKLLSSAAAYIGVIGSRAKTAQINRRLTEDGFSQEAIQRVHTPIGLPIKAVSPEEIAVSIAAEMILERALLREKAGTQVPVACPMHE